MLIVCLMQITQDHSAVKNAHGVCEIDRYTEVAN